MHDPFLGKLAKNYPFFHLFAAIAICFSFLETGYISGKQSCLNIYKTLSDFMIARLCRAYIPSLTVLIFSFVLMPNSILFLNSENTIFDAISQLNITDKIIYYLMHFSLFIQPLLFFKYDESANQIIWQIIHNDNITDAIKLSVAPHLWTFTSDIIAVTAAGILFFKNKKNLSIFLFVLLFISQFFIFHHISNNIFDQMLIWQNPLCLLFLFGAGYFFGYQNFNLLIINKNISAIIGIFLIFLGISLASASFVLKFFPIICFFISVCLFLLASELLWAKFAFNKKDMEFRDMATHLYVWHFFFLSVFYHYFTKSFLNSILIMSFIIIFSYFFGPFFEGHNKKIIKFIQKKFQRKTNE